MARREGNAIQAKILVPDRLKSEDHRVGPNRQLTFGVISDWIRLQGFDEYTENGLIELAAQYPTSALKSFRKNFNLMIARVREQRRREQQQEENRNAISESNKGTNPAGQCSLGSIPAERSDDGPVSLPVCEEGEHGSTC